MSVTQNRYGKQPDRPPDMSVVVSTYNQPEWLRKCLLGFSFQRFTDFEVVIADDGSDDRTRRMIEAVAQETALNIHHVWHEDDGFRKCTILNRAIERVAADYLVFTDGDCIPRADFLDVHARLREPGRFLSGGYSKLPMSTSKQIDEEDIAAQRFASPAWLRRSGCAKVDRKLRVGPKLGWLLDHLSPARASWNGHNASGWRADIEAVNGFDERMAYGGEDRELGERLENAGVRGKRIRHRAVCVHLDHSRGYVTGEAIARNKAIRAETRATRTRWTEFGLRHGETAATHSQGSTISAQGH